MAKKAEHNPDAKRLIDEGIAEGFCEPDQQRKTGSHTHKANERRAGKDQEQKTGMHDHLKKKNS